MKVTEVKIFPVDDDKLKAFVSVVLDECFMVNDIKVIQGRDGRFISMPSRRKRNGRFKDIAHPLNSDTRQMLEEEILDEYDHVIEGRQRRSERIAEAAADNGDGDERTAESPRRSEPEPARERPTDDSPEAGTLEEVTEKHLSDTFWTS